MSHSVFRIAATFAFALVASQHAPAAQAGPVFDAVKQRGVIHCGVNSPGRGGFSIVDGNGQWSGLDVDFCRALAAAVLGDASKVKFVPTSSQTRFTAVQSGEVDVLARNATWTLNRDTALGLSWAGISFYDGQGFIAMKKPGLTQVRALKGSTICVVSGTTTERNLGDYFRANGIPYKAITFDNPETALQAFGSGRCQSYTGDMGHLTDVMAKDPKNPERWQILPDVIAKEPVGPAVRKGDEEWLSVVKWTLFAMIEAEELGLTQANIDQIRATTTDATLRRFVGTGADLGKDLGLDKEWSYRVVKQVGNYGEVFERNLGAKSGYKLPRGRNALWTQGGLMYAPPLR
jgi:general L-amino acid transport system substrate-binding protein